MVVEFMLRGLKTEIDTGVFINLLKAGCDIENEYIIGVIQELIAKCKALEPLNNSILDMLSIADKQTKEIERLETELKQLKEAEDFINKSKQYIRTWRDGEKIDEERTHWETHKNRTCYACGNIGLMISSRKISHHCGREILEWSDYMVKHDE